MAPHRGRTLEASMEALDPRPSDHAPVVVDLPFPRELPDRAP